MDLFRRFGLFLIVNALVVVTLSFLFRIAGLDTVLLRNGLQLPVLLGFCFIWGMVGSFVSLLISRWMAKKAMGVVVVDPRTSHAGQARLVSMVHRLAKSAQLREMPEVGIYPDTSVNAFATGPSSSRSLVAVSTGLLDRMNQDEVEGVLAHEIAHIANGDMVTMTLLQGIVNAFSMFLGYIISYTIVMLIRAVPKEGSERSETSVGDWFLYHMVRSVVDTVLMIGSLIVVNAFSRYREFRADAGGARLAGRGKMVAALEALRRITSAADVGLRSETPANLQALMISGGGGIMSLFMSHPPLEKRIERLQRLR